MTSRFRRNPKSYPVSVQDSVRIDYAHKLTEKNKTWLSAFNESEYGGNAECIEHITGEKVSQGEKQKAWRQAKKRQRDAFSKLRVPEKTLRAGSTNHEDILIELIDLKTKTMKEKI